MLGESAALRSAGIGNHRGRSYGGQVGAGFPADEEVLFTEGAAAVYDVEADDYTDSKDYHGGDAYEEAWVESSVSGVGRYFDDGCGGSGNNNHDGCSR